MCDAVLDSSTSASALSSHVVTCVDGAWSHTDADDVGHGCVEAVCAALTLDDVPHAVVGGCSNTPSGHSCLVECLPG